MTLPFIIGASIALAVIVVRQVIHHLAPIAIDRLDAEGAFEGCEP